MSRDSGKDGFFDQPTRVIGSSSDQQPSPPTDDPFNRPTQVAGRTEPGRPRHDTSDTASERRPEQTPPDRTQVYRPAARDAAGSQQDTGPQAAASPVVGWLVVIAGPGQGVGLPLGYGWNSIGRDGDQMVPLDFGDGEISRANHCAVAYDPKNRKFFVQHGGGRNLTYLGDDPVLAPTELEPFASIAIGRTTLRFVPFCGADFDWQDLPTNDKDGE